MVILLKPLAARLPLLIASFFLYISVKAGLDMLDDLMNKMRDGDLGPIPNTAFNATNKITHTVFSEMNTISQKHCLM
jgi:hypothetical protein